MPALPLVRWSDDAPVVFAELLDDVVDRRAFGDSIGLPQAAAQRVINHLLVVCDEVVQTWPTGLLDFTRPKGKEVLRQLQHRRRPLQPETGS